jgi:hypothetical protein
VWKALEIENALQYKLRNWGNYTCYVILQGNLFPLLCLYTWLMPYLVVVFFSGLMFSWEPDLVSRRLSWHLLSFNLQPELMEHFTQ